MPMLRTVSAACLLTLSALHGQAWAKAQRVISLLPSATEAVCVLGACDRLVGVDDFSLDPPELAALPRLGKTWQPDLEAIVQLQPDLVLVGRTPQVMQKLQALGLNVQEVDALSIKDVRTVLRRLDDLLGTQHAPEVMAAMEQKLQTLRKQARQLPQRNAFISSWMQPSTALHPVHLLVNCWNSWVPTTLQTYPKAPTPSYRLNMWCNMLQT